MRKTSIYSPGEKQGRSHGSAPLELSVTACELKVEEYDLGAFRVEPTERRLLHEGKPISLTNKAFDTLVVLLRRPGHLIEKSELMNSVWGDSSVEEGNLAVAISTVRKALGDNGKKYKYIQTIARHGYRFIGDVREIAKSDHEPCASRRPQHWSTH